MAPSKGHMYRATNSRDTERKPRNKSKSLRQKIRDVRRLLQQPDIPATVRVAQERMLELLQQSVKEKAEEDKERKLAKKYKMVKFFEKRKITRRFKACQSELKSCTDSERSKIESELQQVKDQWNYVTYFPSDTKYISLFPPVPYHNPAVVQKQDEILKMIKGKIERNEIPDACDGMFDSSDNKKKKPLRGGKDATRLKMVVATSKESTATEVPSQTSVEGDDFFIDTNPGTSTDLSPYNLPENVKNAKSLFAVLGSVSKNHPTHKVKRLRNRHEVSAKRWNGTGSTSKDEHKHQHKDSKKNKDNKVEKSGESLAKKMKKKKTS